MEIEFRVHFSPHLVGIGAEKQSMLDSLILVAEHTDCQRRYISLVKLMITWETVV
jgi:hypothetical protein